MWGWRFDRGTELELVARYGFFNDDRDGPQDEVINHRYVCGFNYDVLSIPRSLLSIAIQTMKKKRTVRRPLIRRNYYCSWRSNSEIHAGNQDLTLPDDNLGLSLAYAG